MGDVQISVKHMMGDLLKKKTSNIITTFELNNGSKLNEGQIYFMSR